MKTSVVPHARARVKDREKQERERQQREREKQGGGGQQGCGHQQGGTNKADDRSGFLEVFGRRGLLPPFVCSCADRLQFKSYYNHRVHIARFCSYEIEHKG